MNQDGNIYCGTCDSAHNKDVPDAPLRVRSFLRVDANGKLCEGCHADNTQIAGELALDQMCRSCHDDAPVPAAYPANVVGWSQDIRGAVQRTFTIRLRQDDHCSK